MAVSLREAIVKCLHCAALGPRLFNCNKIPHLNLSHRSTLCRVTSFFEVQGPYLIFAVLSKKAFLIFGMSLKCHVHCADVLALFMLGTCTVGCSVTQVETITNYLRWVSSFEHRAECNSNDNCRSCACQSTAWAVQRLPRVLVAVSSALITIPP